jgi:acetyl-CoA carboxylase biotin carboxyl carrier protein
LDLKELREILQILHEKDITDFELEEQGLKLRIRKGPTNSDGSAVMAPLISAVIPAVAPATAAPPPAVTAASAAPAPASAITDAAEGLQIVKSPIVGTFYRSPDPNSPMFVQVGDRVKSGQVLCIIEAMKLMNEIESEVAGEIVRVHPENGQPVQYGEALFSIRP